MFKGLRLTPDLPPIWLAAFAAVVWLLARWLPLWRFDVAPLGQGIVYCGLALVVWSAIWFWRKDTPIEPGSEPEALIVEGPYRINRNPIYTGLAMILLGYALGQGALIGVVVACVFPVFISRRFVVVEEEALRAAFGAEAEAYISRTRRW